MKDIAIYGAGGFGREVACLINLINRDKPAWNLIGFYDDNEELIGTNNEYGKVIGGIDQLNAYNAELAVAIAIGNPVIVKKSGPYDTEEECLSLQGSRKATRFKNIEVEYDDINFNKRREKFSGWIAEIIQHELDHCDGVII